MNGKDVLIVYDIKGVDRAGWSWAKETYAVEEIANDVFLGKPTVLPIVMAARVKRRGFLG